MWLHLGLIQGSLYLQLVMLSFADSFRRAVPGPPMTDEQRLFWKILHNYDKNTRPVFNSSHPVKVNIGITLTQIFDLDEKNQVLTTNVWLDQQWTDEKLVWNPEDFNGLQKLRIPCRHIWKPDIVLYNSVEDYTDGYMQALAMVSHTGQVFWPPIVKFYSTCQIDITYFPFDDQICMMKLGSWAYDGFQVDVNNRSLPVDLSNYVSNGKQPRYLNHCLLGPHLLQSEWQLISVVAKRNVVYYPCCPEPFPDVTFTIHLRRRTLYYTHNVIIPCVMLSCLTLLVFWMRPDSGEKVTLGLTVLLAFSVFMLLIAENMPATSNFVPLIGVYLTMVMGITSLSVMLAVLVSNISYNGNQDIPLPKFVRYGAIFLARITWYRLLYIQTGDSSSSAAHTARPSQPKRKLYQAGNCAHISNDSGCGLLDLEMTENLTSVENNNRNPSMEVPSLPSSRRRGASPREDEIDVIMKLLQKILIKENSKEENKGASLQWEEVARVLDRFLFYLFFLLTILASLVTLVIMPLAKPAVPSLVNYT
ncbi:unnamed protein product [Candidula unifasciata]|uniref:Uncharacterized protein n=1 Tax=Candidula unifasciata TaxID=100452 RepID=A0A8S3ZI50_9EUPU|nr:unnamed protein product [Candidula unifasciata]